jgi:uncharacterized protein (DUF58 family)
VIPKELLRALRRIEITTRRLATEQLSGNYISGFKGQGLAFSDVRKYQPGDDVRTIDWNVSARMDETFVKVFVEEREMTVMLVVDVSASERFGSHGGPKSRVAAEVAALCAFSAIKNNDRVGLIACSDRVEKLVPPKKGQKHVLRVVREILAAEPAGTGTDLAVALSTLVKVARRRSVAFVLSDFFTTGYERALSLASARHDVVPVMIVDPRDEDMPDVGLANFQDLETGEDVLIDTSDRHVRAHYKASMRLLRQKPIDLFRKFGLDHCIVHTHQPYIAPLRELFARRAKRAHR